MSKGDMNHAGDGGACQKEMHLHRGTESPILPLRNLGAEKETSPLFVPRLWLVQCVGMSDNHEERFLGPRPSESQGCER
jgi:hypothetical protein